MDQKSYIDAASFILTENCNLNCKYCFEIGKRDINQNMSLETAKQAVEFLIQGARKNKSNSVGITYFGGEPLLNFPVLKSSFEYALQRTKEEQLQLNCNIITNATLYPEGYEEFLKFWYDNLGKINVQLSIDGTPEVQNMYRVTHDDGPSSHMVEKIVEKYFKFVKENNIPDMQVHVHGCINKHSLPKLYESYNYFRNLGFSSIWFLPVQEENWDDNDVELFKIECQKIADYIFDECIRTKSIKTYEGYVSLKNCKVNFPSAPCGAGKSYATITANGDLHPCHNIYFGDKNTFKFGNVYSGEQIEKRSFFLEYGSSNMFGDQPCHDCGNTSCYRCIAANYNNNDNFLIGFPSYCKISRAENEIRKELARKLTEAGLIKNPYEQNNNSLVKVIKAIEEDVYDIRVKLKNNENQFDVVNDKLNTILEIMGYLTENIMFLNNKINKKE